ncbi:hypothetical protein IWQ61_005556 [Dispira simplex]|nr:hypothetical protein IWQ61_005556 [Dispira simplex]
MAKLLSRTNTLVPTYSGEWFVRALVFGLFLVVHAVLINLSQFVAMVILYGNPRMAQRWYRHTEHYFTVVLVLLTQWLAPTQLVLTHDDSLPALIGECTTGSNGEARRSDDSPFVQGVVVWPGKLARCLLSPRAIVMANHQIYMDWIYLWFLAYYNGCAGGVKIILKNSLRNIPVFGWGMQFFRFIFLNRQWEKDKQPMLDQLHRAAQSGFPHWLTLFPEGTTITTKAQAKSHAYAEDKQLPKTRHVLLPRCTGLYHSCHAMRKVTDYVYDVTMGFEGLTSDQTPQDTYTIPMMYISQFYPRHVHLHVRRIPMDQVPTDGEEFTQWLRQRWYEKDALMAYFYRHGRFPHGTSVFDLPSAQIDDTKVKSSIVSKVTPDIEQDLLPNPCARIEVQVRSWFELGQLWLFFIAFIWTVRLVGNGIVGMVSRLG